MSTDAPVADGVATDADPVEDPTQTQGPGQEPVAGDGGEPTPVAETDESAAEGRAWLDQVDKDFGTNLVEKYEGDHHKAVEGMAHATKTVSERNEKAEAWDKIRAQFSDDQLHSLVTTGELPPPPEAQAEPAKVADAQKFDASWFVLDGQGGVTRAPHAPPNAAHLYQERLLQMATDPMAALKEPLEAIMAPLRETVETSQSQAQERANRAEWRQVEDEFADQLFVDGDRQSLSTIGQRVNDNVENFGITDARRLRRLIELVHGTGNGPPLKGAKAPLPKSMRQATATKPAKVVMSIEQMFKSVEDGGLGVSTLTEARVRKKELEAD